MRGKVPTGRTFGIGLTSRRGTVIPLVTLSMTMLFGFAALAIDTGQLYNVRADLQKTADAAVLAAAGVWASNPDATEPELLEVAQQYASLNHPGRGLVLAPADFELGRWDAANRTFLPGSTDSNLDKAVRVITRRSSGNDNAVDLFFGACTVR